mgnify:CR=1 FL=1
MSIFKPPTPVIIASSGGGGGGSGTSLNTSDASVILNTDPDTGSSNIIIATNNEPAIVINESQNVLIGSTSSLPSQRLVVTTPNGNGIALIHESNQARSTLDISSLGTLSIRTTGDTIDAIGNNFLLDDNSIILNGVTVNATANQLNYLIATPGAASPSKALILNSNSNITGINALAATSLTGTLQTAYQPNINRVSNLNIENTLSLGGISVQSSAVELNYVNVTPGTASTSKALVLDTSSNITGINALSASQLTGTIQTGAQPNITSLGTVSNLKLTGFLGVGTNSPTTDIEIYSISNPVLKLNNGTFSSNIAIDTNGNLKLNSDGNVIIQNNHSLQLNGNGEIFGANRISATYLVGTIETTSQPNITTIGTLTNLVVNGTIGVGTNSPNKKIEILDSAGDCLRLSRTNSYYADILISPTGDLQLLPVGDVVLGSGTSIKLNAGTITGLSSITATSITGTLATAIQSNITTIGTLGSLTVTNGVSAGSVSATTITGTLQTASQTNITTIGTLGSLTVTNGISAGSVSATTITGTLQTANQTNITTIGTLGSLSVNNSITADSIEVNDITGTLLTSSQPNINEIGVLTNLTVSDTLTVANINATDIYGALGTANQSNITTVGTLFSLDVTGAIASGSLSATTITGTLQTANQSNITTIGTLGSLTVTNGISAGSLSATTITGTLQTASQTNITTVGTLSRVYTSGKIGIGMTNPAYEIDITSSDGKMLQILYNTNTVSFDITSNGDCSLSTNNAELILANGTGLTFSGGGTISGLTTLTATNVYGTIQTASQPNITTIGALSTLTTTTILIGDTHTSNYDLSIVSNTGQLYSLTYGAVVVTNRISAGEYIINSSTGRIALDTNVDLVLNGGTIIGLDNISVANLSTTITEAAQPNITSLGTLTELTVSGLVSLTSNNAEALSVSGGAHIYGDLTVDGDFTFGGTLSLNNLNLSTLSVTGGYTASSSTNGGTLTITGGTAISDNLYVGTTLDVGTSISLDGTVLDFSNLNLLSNITTGTVSANTIFVADSSGNLSGFNQLSATELYGSIETATQTSITRVGTLSDLNVSGYLGVGTITPLQQLEINSTTGDCLRLSYDKATSSTNFATFLMSSAGKLTITSSGGATTIPQISATQISLGNTSNTTMPLEIGFTAFVFSGAYAYNTSTNSKGTIAAGGTTSYNYSIRALGRILCTQSVDVTSDRRLKYNIKDLSDDYCAKFVNDTTPVSFNWKNGDSMASYGYIAQDLLRHGFDDLVNLAHDDNMEQEVDTDGLISPSGIKFTISYQHIIPILAKNQKKLMQENKELHEKVDKLMDIIQQLMR